MSTVSHVIVKKGAGNGSFTSSWLIACVYLYCVTVFGNQSKQETILTRYPKSHYVIVLPHVIRLYRRQPARL